MMLSKSKSKEDHANSWFGVALVIFNLLLDGFTNSKQDNLFITFKELTSKQMMFGMNIASAVWMLIYLIYENNELYQGLHTLQQHPAILTDVLLFCVVGAVGQIFIFQTLENFGSRTLVTVNVTRKMFSILLSVFWFSHGVSFEQWVAVVLVFSGILLESGMKSRAVSQRTEEQVMDINGNATAPLLTKKKKRD